MWPTVARRSSEFDVGQTEQEALVDGALELNDNSSPSSLHTAVYPGRAQQGGHHPVQQPEPLSMDGLADSESHELTTAGDGSGREMQARVGSSSGTNRREPGITAMEQQRWSEASSEHTIVGETERKSANHQGGQLDSKSVVAGNEQRLKQST